MKRYKTNFMLFLFYLLLALFCNQHVLSARQAAAVDSLERLLLTKLPVLDHVDVLNELAWEAKRINPDRAFQAAEEALNVSKSLYDLERISTSLNRMGEVLRLRDRYKEAVLCFEEALEIEKAIDYQYGIARALGQLTLLYTNLGKYDSAIHTGQEGLKIYQELDLPHKVARSHQRLATAFESKWQLDSAAEQLHLKLKVQERFNDHIVEANTFISLGTIYRKLKSYDRSLDYLMKAYQNLVSVNHLEKLANVTNSIGNTYKSMGDLSRAEKYYEESLHFFNKMVEPTGAFRLHINMGTISQRLGKYDKAILQYKDGLIVAKEISEKSDITLATMNIGKAFLQSGEPDSAQFWFAKLQNDSTLTTAEALDLSRNLAAVAKENNQPELYNKYLAKHLHLRDSLDRILAEASRVKDNLEESRKQAALFQKDLEKAQT
ncbi:MAG: tetratricopeptide repeat protein, partial [Cyclobacteriaceae bacterium]